MVFNLNAVVLGKMAELSPKQLADIEAVRPAGCEVPIPKGLCMSGLFEVAGKMSHSCIPSCNCEASPPGLPGWPGGSPNLDCSPEIVVSLPPTPPTLLLVTTLSPRPIPIGSTYQPAQGIQTTTQLAPRSSGPCATSRRARS